jgi:hypothetical protein
MRHRIVAALALIAASSLHAQTPATAPAPALAPAPVTPPAIPDLSTAVPISGNWSYAATVDGSEAVFLNPGAQPQVVIHCARALRRVTISKTATGAAPFLSIWTSTQTRNLPASFNPATGRVSADLSASDSLLDAIAFSRGRFGVRISGQPSLVVPAWAEPARVIEDCRS